MTKIPDINNIDNLTPNDWADYYRYNDGANVIPANTKEKETYIKWKQWENCPVPEEQHEQWKAENAFDDGMALIAGKALNAEDEDKRKLNLILCDFDNKKAQDEFRTRNGVITPLKELAKELRIEQYDDDPDKCHTIFYATYPFRNKSSDVTNKTLKEKIDKNEIPAMEIKSSNGILFVTPSPNKKGNNRRIIGTMKLIICDAFEQHFDNILNKYGIPYLTNNGNAVDDNKTPINELFNEDTEIYEGHNRHLALLRVMESLIVRNRKIMSLDEIKKIAIEWNKKHCIPPLDDKEVDKQWEHAIIFVERNQEDQQYDELKDNIYYKTNEKPARYIIAHKKTHTVIEVQEKSREDTVNGNKIIKYYLVHNRKNLACIPVKIIRHRNPLTFLQLQETFTIHFVDAIGEHYIFSHKTLSAIIQSLKERALVLGEGADSALSSIIQGFKQRNLIEINEELGYTGFFKVGNKILASNLEIKEPSIDKLKDALEFIEELKTYYYENRLDLLATSIVWGIVAPAIFMLKTNNYFLKGLNFYGFSNATKSNTGKIILAIDGNHEDHNNHALNFNMVDTTAKLGAAVSRSTFPILIDEVDLNDIRNSQLVNMVKIIIESVKARDKFANSKDSEPSSIPALSCLILTSNLPPPFHNSGLMRRLISRPFPINESWKQDDPKALSFKEYLRVNLPRLKSLGDFRNWYVMNHQAEILDEKRPEPLEIGLKILKEAFTFCGKEIPQWLVEKRLPENQLEESMQDNDVIVKRAFEKYIDEQFNKAIQFWKSQLATGETIQVPKDISDRLVKLAQSNVLPDIKYTRNFEVIIRKGILTELYNHGATKDQLPNLKALADYMKTDYRISDGKTVVSATVAKLSKYFDESSESSESPYIDTNKKNHVSNRQRGV